MFICTTVHLCKILLLSHICVYLSSMIVTLFLFQFESIFDEVSEYLEDVLAASHFGVTVSLAERCQKLGTRQEKYREVS